jgi:hypothetical protein
MSTPTTLLCACIAACFGGVAPCVAADADAPQPLYHRFEIPADGAFGAVSIDLVPAAWRVGHADGPPADAAQLDAVLAQLSRIRVRGRCGSIVDGATEYPCSFALARLAVDGIPAARLDGVAGGGAATFSIAAVAGAPLAEEAALGGDRSRIDRVLEVVASIAGAGEPGARAGGRIAFSFRAVPNSIAPAAFDPHSGVVVLQPRPRGTQGGVQAASPSCPVA